MSTETIKTVAPIPEPCGWIATNYSHESSFEGVYESHNATQPRRGWAPVYSQEQMEAEHTRAEAQAQRAPEGWKLVSDSLPLNRKLIVAWKNRLGNWRRAFACYYEAEQLESEQTESGWADEGWYEVVESQDEIPPLDGDPTHWMPLPLDPDAAASPQSETPK